jgi:hypothetical protein
MPFIRRIWVRSLIVATAIMGIDFLVLSAKDIYPYRRAFLDALIATSLIFAIMASLIMVIINNYVKGLREQFIEQLRRVRRLAWDCHDNFSGSGNPELEVIIKSHIWPLLKKSFRDWSQIENIQLWGKDIEEQLMKLLKTDNPPPRILVFLYQYLLPLEDEINELGLLYIRRAGSVVHSRNASGVYYLLSFAIVVIAFGLVLPSAARVDLTVLNSAAAVIIYGVLELLFVLSFVLQEVREETFTEL